MWQKMVIHLIKLIWNGLKSNKKEKVIKKEQNDIIKRTTAIEENKLTNDFKKSEIDLKKSETNISETKSSKKLYVVAGLVALFLVLGTIVFLKKKS